MADDIQAQLEQKYNIPQLIEDKEAEVKQIVVQLEKLKEGLSKYQITGEQLSTSKNQFEEEKKDLTENLKKVGKTLKKKKEVLTQV
jgi:hypothetical protein